MRRKSCAPKAHLNAKFTQDFFHEKSLSEKTPYSIRYLYIVLLALQLHAFQEQVNANEVLCAVHIGSSLRKINCGLME
jgi:hypothetical protein